MQKLKLNKEQILFSVSEDLVAKLRDKSLPPIIIGQDRAINAIKLGLGIKEKGYNLFLMGAPGTGKRTALEALLVDFKFDTDSIFDIAYVYNFPRPLEPLALFFKAGTASEFKQNLNSAIRSIQKQVVLIRQSSVFENARRKIIERADKEEFYLFNEIKQKFLRKGFKVEIANGEKEPPFYLDPIYKDKATSFEELENLSKQGKVSAEELLSLKELYISLSEQMNVFIYTIAKNRKKTGKKLNALIKNYAGPIIDNELALLTSLYKKESSNKAVVNWLSLVRKDLLSKADKYSEEFSSSNQKTTFFNRYNLNIIYEYKNNRSFIVYEKIPSFRNLFGFIETSESSQEKPKNTHMSIRPGAVHKAFGGFLVLRVQDLLNEEASWQHLKRALDIGKTEIQNSSAASHSSIVQPQSLPANFKAVLVGNSEVYHFLFLEDPDFIKLFKICAEFDSTMPRTDENIQYLISFIDYYTNKKKFLPLDNSGIARILRHLSRIAENRTRLSSQFTHVVDLLAEANFHAKSKNKTMIDSITIEETLTFKRNLYNLAEQKFINLIDTNQIVLDVKGVAIGKTTGISYSEHGFLAFGMPLVITAQASPGNKGLINIEAESGLSGEIFDKAHLIIQGLLTNKYAKDFPLALTASISLEQSYELIDGDSASCAMFYALLSAISKIPLRQDIAITGSVNQIGDVQPVGGVCEKIEAFFDACLALGLTKTQGVIIPSRNTKELILSERVERAIMNEEFHIWTINNIDEGIQLLTNIDIKEFNRKVVNVLKQNAEKIKHLTP